MASSTQLPNAGAPNDASSVVPDPTDEVLAVRAREGDRTAFELLMRRNNRRVYRTIRAVLRDGAEVEDAMQEAYVSAFTHLDQFHGAARWSTWLCRIAYNEALARVRRGKRFVSIDASSEAGMKETDAPKTTSPDPERAVGDRELARVLEGAIDRLPDIYRAVLVLRQIDGLSVAETAEVLDVAEEVVKTRLNTALVPCCAPSSRTASAPSSTRRTRSGRSAATGSWPRCSSASGRRRRSIIEISVTFRRADTPWPGALLRPREDLMSVQRSLRHVTLASSILFAVSGCATAPATPAAAGPSAAAPATFADQVAAGQTLYAQNCASCHGDAGQGDKAPRVVGIKEGALPLDPPADRKYRKTRFVTVADVATFVVANMPPKKAGSLTADQYWAILAFDLHANGIDLPAPLTPAMAATLTIPR